MELEALLINSTTHTRSCTPSIVTTIHMILLLFGSDDPYSTAHPAYLMHRALGPSFSMQAVINVCVCVPRVPKFSIQDVVLSP